MILCPSHYLNPWRELQKNLWKKQIPSFGIETLLVRKDGSSFPCAVTSILFQDNGTTLGYTILEDISERKAVEEKLKRLYDSQEILVHMVAHDLKKKLHSIATLASFLKKDIASFEEEHAPKKAQSLSHIQMIEDSCQKAYSIINDLLLIGEIELSKQHLNKQSTKTKSFLDPLIDMFQYQANEKAIAISFVFPQEEVYAQIN